MLPLVENSTVSDYLSVPLLMTRASSVIYIQACTTLLTLGIVITGSTVDAGQAGGRFVLLAFRAAHPGILSTIGAISSWFDIYLCLFIKQWPERICIIYC